jgi:hypothetical protein
VGADIVGVSFKIVNSRQNILFDIHMALFSEFAL